MEQGAVCSGVSLVSRNFKIVDGVAICVHYSSDSLSISSLVVPDIVGVITSWIGEPDKILADRCSHRDEIIGLEDEMSDVNVSMSS